MKIRLRTKFFAVNLSLSSFINAKAVFDAIAPKRDSVICVYLYSKIMKPIDYKNFFRNFTAMLGRNAECYADVALPKLS
jgi:hypothetical protein